MGHAADVWPVGVRMLAHYVCVCVRACVQHHVLTLCVCVCVLPMLRSLLRFCLCALSIQSSLCGHLILCHLWHDDHKGNTLSLLLMWLPLSQQHACVLYMPTTRSVQCCYLLHTTVSKHLPQQQQHPLQSCVKCQMGYGFSLCVCGAPCVAQHSTAHVQTPVTAHTLQ